jgi:hypothetical protein
MHNNTRVTDRRKRGFGSLGVGRGRQTQGRRSTCRSSTLKQWRFAGTGSENFRDFRGRAAPAVGSWGRYLHVQRTSVPDLARAGRGNHGGSIPAVAVAGDAPTATRVCWEFAENSFSFRAETEEEQGRLDLKWWRRDARGRGDNSRVCFRRRGHL